MTGAIPVSLVVVSRHRPALLRRCLNGIAQLDHPAFELIVVADPASLATLGQCDGIKCAPCHEANISAARNIGLGLAAGEVVAFIDDDAVPEPSWLSRLAAPFADPAVGMAGGFVRGHNGISYQWRAQSIDRLGRDRPVAVDGPGFSLHAGDAAATLAPLGTNAAFRRRDVLAAGGFDPAYRYFRDESDLALRLAGAGRLMAVVPGAQVHHGKAPSSRRDAARVPLDLRETGASAMVFLRRHAAAESHAEGLDHLRRVQAARLRALVFAGKLKARRMRRLLISLEDGIVEGRSRVLPALSPLDDTPPAFMPFRAVANGRGRVLAGRPWQRARLRREAGRAAGDGTVVTVFRFSPTALYHRMRFHPDGYWEQTGGLFGRSERDQPLVRWWRFEDRLRAEIARISPFRPVG